MPRFGVTPQKEKALAERMGSCGLREKDIEERFIRSGGPGGQKVNRTATCVYLMHGPTGLEVKMQKARSQSLNRFYARRRMCELIEQRTLGAQSPESLRQEKIRRQKSRRRRRGKTKAAGGEGRQVGDGGVDSG
ncbi:MAG: peptide chain release factor-like protein [Candidatus Hydrogenedentes bacterium]|jgi:protein subunit release factor B|nr:peptide chain release factor-like protein [Candidatus Hydrogenedentota bacterium]